MLPKSIDEQIAGLEKLIAGRRGLQLGSFLLFVDCYLIMHFRVNLLLLDWEWAKSHIGIGGAATIVFFFFLFSNALIPWIQFFLLLPSIIGSELLISKWTKSEGKFVEGVKRDKLLEFAIIKGNSIAYQEYLRKETTASEYLKDIRWGFVFLCFLGLDAFVAKGASESILEVFWLALRRLPPWIFFPSIAALMYLLFMLLLSSLVTVRFTTKYYLVGPKLYHLIEGSMVTDQEVATEEA